MKKVIDAKVAELQKRYPGYHVVVYFWDDAEYEFSQGSLWIKEEWTELKDDGGVFNPKSWHYQAFMVAKGKMIYNHKGMKSQDLVSEYIGATVGLKFDWDTKTLDFDSTPAAVLQSMTWMSGLPDGTSLANLAIPGSHSSCAAGNLIKLGYLDVMPKLEQKDTNAIIEMETRQYDDVPSQLKSGIRMLDVRVGAGLKIHQGPFQLPQTLATVLDQAEAFLKASTREVVLICISWCSETLDSVSTLTSTSDDPVENFAHEVRTVLKNKGPVVYAQSSWPTIETVRGRIVILHTFQSDVEDCGIDVRESWPSSLKLSFKASMPDQVSTAEGTTKPSPNDRVAKVLQPEWNRIKNSLDQQHGHVLAASLAGMIRNNSLGDEENWVSPFKVSEWIQPQFLRWASEKKPGPCRLWIFADFAGADFAMAVARLNYVFIEGPKAWNNLQMVRYGGIIIPP
ncbi:1-phosphatidylinositol phosphodiesterase [Apiospora saccharicola]